MFENILNKKISLIELNKSKDELTLGFEDGMVQIYGVKSECCSSSWIEHLELPPDVIGATVISVVELEETLDDPDYDRLSIYQTHFDTTSGTICLEYRNSSNGYYGGWLYEK